MKKLAHWAPAPNLTIQTVERDETNWAVSLSGGDHAICPVCRVRSHSRHSSYRRTLRDLPAQGTPVEVWAQMTRWRCRNDRCERRIFAERIPGLAAPFARRTTRLAGIVRLFGHSAGGRPSERLMARLGMLVGHCTILRPNAAVTLHESVRLPRFRTAAAGNGETKTGLRLVFAANMRITDGRR